MKFDNIKETLQKAVDRLVKDDVHLLKYDLSERCIASRLAFYLQGEFQDFHVDVEYNRDSLNIKKLCLSGNHTDKIDEYGCVSPDIIIHKRNSNKFNILVLELKKTSHRGYNNGSDKIRICSFKSQLDYSYGATILCYVRPNENKFLKVEIEWVTD